MLVVLPCAPEYLLTLPQAYLILAVVLGASIGHFVFGATMDVEAVLAGGDSGKGMACH
jgi:solute carrier family 31 (copper transporter), member 1